MSMDKYSYKEIIKDNIEEIDRYKSIVKEIWLLISQTPNDNQLGESIREYYHNKNRENELKSQL